MTIMETGLNITFYMCKGISKIGILAFSLYLTYGGMVFADNTNLSENHVYPITLSDFVKTALKEENRNKEFYSKIFNENMKLKKDYGYLQEYIINKSILTEKKYLNSFSLVTTKEKNKEKLFSIEINFSKNVESCFSIFPFMDVMERFPLRQYHHVMDNIHNLSSKSPVSRLYVWHPYQTETIMGADLKTPQCISQIEIIFDKSDFLYAVDP